MSDIEANIRSSLASLGVISSAKHLLFLLPSPTTPRIRHEVPRWLLNTDHKAGDCVSALTLNYTVQPQHRLTNKSDTVFSNHYENIGFTVILCCH